MVFQDYLAVLFTGMFIGAVLSFSFLEHALRSRVAEERKRGDYWYDQYQKIKVSQDEVKSVDEAV